jgi:hypothetical protein
MRRTSFGGFTPISWADDDETTARAAKTHDALMVAKRTDFVVKRRLAAPTPRIAGL